ncbi:uncharacterized protein SCHCODRAFT_02633098 [Schizophyllum commune H4-8]|nr:uncharacterized protein SCHCODRAFT_02633098 [Schizophyllum commune H4-8]KAI5888918.1 hypothetical protein SCHCODRAFT_02633098 [Schizophyllum commune H4-8]
MHYLQAAQNEDLSLLAEQPERPPKVPRELMPASHARRELWYRDMFMSLIGWPYVRVAFNVVVPIGSATIIQPILYTPDLQITLHLPALFHLAQRLADLYTWLSSALEREGTYCLPSCTIGEALSCQRPRIRMYRAPYRDWVTVG